MKRATQRPYVLRHVDGQTHHSFNWQAHGIGYYRGFYVEFHARKTRQARDIAACLFESYRLALSANQHEEK